MLLMRDMTEIQYVLAPVAPNTYLAFRIHRQTHRTEET